ncbi:PaaI family thioesterase [Oceanicoccus sp. KOV_DT_Chl]|uniref:PaaI family thioesterase n=1 Tax=Oceanicoccus sp. KOV_DT_Chl TaxID=1904639 RepID=UPI000C7C478C|nr:PaaI family thioesterase [Oceanicoccus sp. KOV_DT_Chl]
MTDPAKTMVSPYIDYLGIKIIHMENGIAEMELELTDDFKNSGGMAHGGVLASLADSAAGSAAFTIVPANQIAVTTDFTMTCLRSTVSGTLYARAEMIHTGKRFMRAEVKIRSARDLLVTAGVSFMVVERR